MPEQSKNDNRRQGNRGDGGGCSCFLVGGQLLVIRECPKVEEVPELSFGHGRGLRRGGNLRLMTCFCN